MKRQKKEEEQGREEKKQRRRRKGREKHGEGRRRGAQFMCIHTHTSILDLNTMWEVLRTWYVMKRLRNIF